MADPGKSILVVEDDRDLAEALGETLDDEGYHVVLARNGREALDLLESGRAQPALILLDLMMPVMDGWEFQRRLEDGPFASIPIVVCTAAGQADRKARDLKAAGHIEKPPSIDTLIEVIEGALRS